MRPLRVALREAKAAQLYYKNHRLKSPQTLNNLKALNINDQNICLYVIASEVCQSPYPFPTEIATALRTSR